VNLLLCGAAVWVENVMLDFIISMRTGGLICPQSTFNIISYTYFVITFKSIITYDIYVSSFIFNTLLYLYIHYFY